MDLKDKKLLIMGGNPDSIALVETANRLGVHTIVTSYLPDDKAKKVASESFEVDGMDVEGLVALAKRENVDGVMVGVADPLIPHYYQVCTALNLPCYAPSQTTVDVFSNKVTFKAKCEEYGIRGVPEYYLDEKMDPKDMEKIKYPAVVKPVDGRSSTGVTICYTEKELRNAVEKALAASNQKRFIIEKFMDCDDVGMYYTFKDGICSLSAMWDTYREDEQVNSSRITLSSIYPSVHLQRYFDHMHQNVCRMFSDLGIKNGIVQLAMFYEDGEFYVFDPGFRLQGGAPNHLIKAINGFDQLEMMIRFALTGSGGDFDLHSVDDPYLKGKAAANLWFILKKGIIGKISGLEEAAKDPKVVYIVKRFDEGDEVFDSYLGTEKQVCAKLFVVCDSRHELAETLKHYVNTIKVTDKDGNNMLLKGLDVDNVPVLK